MNLDQVYSTVKNNSDGLDAIYEDYIIHLVGYVGFIILKENELIESCGVVEGRKLYSLVKKNVN